MKKNGSKQWDIKYTYLPPMKKKIITAIVALLSLVSAVPTMTAQNSILLDDPANRSYLGVRAGVDISSPSPDYYKNGAGFHIGLVYNFKIVKNFYIEPGASVYYNTWSLRPERLHLTPRQLPSPRSLDGMKDFSGSFRNIGVRIPLMFGYHFDFTPTVNVAIFTGPELNIGTRSRFHYSAPIETDTGVRELNGRINCYSPGPMGPGDSQIDKLLYYMQDIFKRVDCAWKIGVGVNYDNFHVSIGGAIGMTNVYKHHNVSAFSDDAFRMNRLTVTVGYNF